MTRRTHARRGMTLVELLVSAAMSIMVMWLLTWCYQQGLASFSNTKAQGDLMDMERQVSSLMTRDLALPHFLADETKPNQGLRVSDQFVAGKYVAPQYGYFAATSQTYTVNEGTDGDSFGSTISTAHVLQFTTVLPGGPPQNLFSAELTTTTAPASPTPSTYYGRAAEIAYFLVPSGATTTGSTPQPLYNLYRRQRLCAMTSDDAQAYNLSGATTVNVVTDVMSTAASGAPSAWTVFNMKDLTATANRLTVAPIATPARIGEDILMSNVVSMEIKFTGSSTATSVASWPTSYLNSAGTVIQNSDYPYDNLPGTGTFDTATSTNPVRITGIMVRLRAYSPRTFTTRQTTFIVPL